MTLFGINFRGTFRGELLSLSCPAFTNSLLPVLEVVDTFTDIEPKYMNSNKGGEFSLHANLFVSLMHK